MYKNRTEEEEEEEAAPPPLARDLSLIGTLIQVAVAGVTTHGPSRTSNGQHHKPWLSSAFVVIGTTEAERASNRPLDDTNWAPC